MKLTIRARRRIAGTFAAVLTCVAVDVRAQESDKPSPSETPAPNALYGLFQMQPQYPTPGTTVMFPEAVPAHLGDDKSAAGRQPGQSGQVFQPGWGQENKPVNPADNHDNPLKGLFQMQPQYPTPGTTVMFPESVPAHLGDDKSTPGRQPGQQGQVYQPPAASSDGKAEASGNKDNLLKGLFQQQPQYATPGTTVMFPEAVPAHLGDDSSVSGRQPGQSPPRLQSSLLQSEESPLQQSSEKPELKTEPSAEAEKEKSKIEGERAASEESKAKQEAQEGAADIKKGEEDVKKGQEDGNKDEVEKGKEEIAKGTKEEAEAKVDEAKAKVDAANSKKDAEQAKVLEEKEKAKAAETAKGTDKSAEKTPEKDKGKEKEKPAYNPLREAIDMMNNGKREQALVLLNKLINYNAKNTQAYYLRAVLHVSLKQYQNAADDYKTVLKLVPSGDLRERAEAGLRKIHF